MFQSLVRFLIRFLPASLGLRLIRLLAERTLRPPLHPAQQEALAHAQPLRYGHDGSHTAWSWGHGPLVVLVHGWNGRAGQMAPLAAHLAQQGMRCVAIEITGHGSSPGRRTSWGSFIHDVAALQRTLGEPVHAWVGHSAGALTLMAARAAGAIQGARFVSICAPSHPFPPIAVIRQKLNPPEPALQRYREHIAGQFGLSWSALEGGAAWRGTVEPQLLFYDATDRFVPHTEGDRVAALCPQARLVKTHGYSHTKVLGAPEMMRAVSDFVVPG
ncbi:MAG: alpha/beta fold hydrolase [Ramlibacter sp.]|nr:alpha/beta fold hydrolase [Ramlibacter sp.]